MSKKYVIIPARGGSKGIPGKNLIIFHGKPLITWTIEQAKYSESIDNVYVSTECNAISTISNMYGANVIDRPDILARDNSNSDMAIDHAISTINTDSNDIIIYLQPTSPLRFIKDIDNAIELFEKEKYDSLFSCVKIKEDLCIWTESNKSLTYDYNDRLLRQMREELYLENGSIYIFRVKGFNKCINRLHGKIGRYEMEDWQKYEIDIYDDIDVCKKYMDIVIEKNNLYKKER